jgi:lipoprotein-anchoring transpeptidase ErfK/SrfK
MPKARARRVPALAPARLRAFIDGLKLAKLAGRMKGGALNPMGPRALYLYRDGRDLLYRIHGTLEPWTIGSDVSSGCIRLLPEDLIDLTTECPPGPTCS